MEIVLLDFSFILFEIHSLSFVPFKLICITQIAYFEELMRKKKTHGNRFKWN